MFFVRTSVAFLMVFLLTACATDERAAEGQAASGKPSLQDIYVVGGCVHHPGRFTIEPGVTVTLADALQKAGGPITGNYFAGQHNARLNAVRIIRIEGRSSVTYKVDMLYGDQGRSFNIQPRDQIIVPENA